uniref:Protein kinase domain-containing protein n=1 Tax=Knipowitschia caucasica TaxID=637954 RepID=A0AAV2M4V8_KNICA
MSADVIERYIPEKYQFVKRLTRGGYGQVVLCFVRDSQEEVAIKVPYFKQNTDREIALMRRLMAEGMDQKNFVKFIESFPTPMGNAMVFEKLDMSMWQYCQKFDLSLSEVSCVLQQVATALSVLKDWSIVHADLSLPNVMVVNAIQNPLQVKLIDFGMSRLASRTQRGVVLQHVNYSQKAQDVEAAIDLLEEMLKMDADERITPKAILVHPFIQKLGENLFMDISGENADNSTKQLHLDTEDECTSLTQNEVAKILPEGYEVTKMLGNGQFGQMVLVKPTGSVKCVTLKIPHSNNRTQREVRLLQKIAEADMDHKNLVRFLETWDTSCGQVIVMEEFRMGLLEVMEIESPLAFAQIRYIVRHMAEALKALESRGIIHTGVMAENIWVCGVDRPIFKLAGFGAVVRRKKAEPGMNVQHSCLSIKENYQQSELVGCINLIKQMLHMDPAQRITPAQILKHPFIQQKNEADKLVSVKKDDLILQSPSKSPKVILVKPAAPENIIHLEKEDPPRKSQKIKTAKPIPEEKADLVQKSPRKTPMVILVKAAAAENTIQDHKPKTSAENQAAEKPKMDVQNPKKKKTRTVTPEVPSVLALRKIQQNCGTSEGCGTSEKLGDLQMSHSFKWKHLLQKTMQQDQTTLQPSLGATTPKKKRNFVQKSLSWLRGFFCLRGDVED